MHSRGFRTSDPQQKLMGQSTEMSPLVSLLFWTFLTPWKFLMDTFNILNIFILFLFSFLSISFLFLIFILFYFNTLNILILVL